MAVYCGCGTVTELRQRGRKWFRRCPRCGHETAQKAPRKKQKTAAKLVLRDLAAAAPDWCPECSVRRRINGECPHCD